LIEFKLKHLTSLQHENFERNLSNFKEIDELINGFLSFNSFLVKKGLLKEVPVDMPATPSPIEPVTDINELKLFAKTFSNRRMKLGIGQTQIVNELKAETNNLINETTLSRFEKLDITPRSGAKMKPVLDRWINETELKFADRMKAVTAERSQINMETQSNQAETPSKKRKRLDSFSPRTIETLNESYRSNQNPSG
jgi:class 6 POU domain transcription factor